MSHFDLDLQDLVERDYAQATADAERRDNARAELAGPIREQRPDGDPRGTVRDCTTCGWPFRPLPGAPPDTCSLCAAERAGGR